MVCPVCKADNRPGAKFCQECAVKLEFRCPQCGGPTAPGAKFCQECGLRLDFRCPQCGTPTAPGAKFCQECGSRLELRCFQCGIMTPPGAKFCQECGTRLELKCPQCGGATLIGSKFCNWCGLDLLRRLAPAFAPLVPEPVAQPPAYAPAPPVIPEAPPVVTPPDMEPVAPPSAYTPAPPVAPEAPPVVTPPAPEPVAPPSAYASAPPVIPEAPPAAVPPVPEVSEPLPPPSSAPLVSPAPAVSVLESPPSVVEAPPTPDMVSEDERRLVTILFGDVSGFTAMSEKLDAEDTKNIMDSCLKLLADQVVKYDGTVDKFEGDLIMATWGAPLAHEDDAERAVMAAVGMQEDLTRFSAQLERRRGFTLKMRIGVNTGEVIAGAVGSKRGKDYTVMGDVVNTASRFESNATPGKVMVGLKTYNLTRHMIQYKELEPIKVKGKTDPLPVFEVVGTRLERMHRRGIAGLTSHMIGRDEELVALLETFNEVNERRSPRLVTLFGVPGMGKSRLLGEFQNGLDDSSLSYEWAKGRCLPYGQGITFFPLGEILKNTFAIKESDSADEAQVKLLSGVRGILTKGAATGATADSAVEEEVKQVAHRLGYAIGISFPDSTLPQINPANIKDELFWAWRHIFRRWAEMTPLIIVFEDVHWADNVILDLIRHLASSLDDAPILLLCLSRPELLERRPQWGEEFGGKTLNIHPLTSQEALSLVDSLLSPNHLSQRWKERLVEKSGGIPFFIEEMIKVFLDNGAIIQGPSGWVFSQSEKALEVPDTIFATIAARLDRLQPGERGLLQRASVVGDVFWQSALSYPAPDLGSEAAVLGALKDKDMVREHLDSSFADDRELAFQNSSVRDVSYQGLTRARRTREHGRVGRWLENKVGGRVEEFIESLSHHYSQAVGVELDKDFEPAVKAIHYLWLAGERARLRQSYSEAVSRYNRTVEILRQLTLEEDGAPREVDGISLINLELQANLAWAQALEPVGEYDPALEKLNLVLEGAQKDGSLLLLGSAYHQKAKVLRIKGELEDAAVNAHEAIQIFAQEEEPEGQAQALLVLGEVFSDQAKLAEFEKVCRDAVTLSREGGTRWVEARGLTLLGTACVYQGKVEEAQGYIEGAVASYRDLGDRRGRSTSLLMLGRIQHMRGQVVPAVDAIEEAISVFEELGDRRAMASAAFSLGLINLEQGNLEEARRAAERGLAQAAAVKEAAMRLRCLLLLAQAEIEMAQWAPALAHLKEAEELATATGQKGAQPEVYRVLAEAYLGDGNLEEAEKYARLGREVVAEDDLYSQGTTWLALADVLAKKGQTAEAEEAYQKAIQSLEESGEEFEVGLSHLRYAEFLMAQGKASTEVKEHLEKAKEPFEALGSKGKLEHIDRLLEKL